MPVVDASVWVSLCHEGDRHHKKSRAWLEARLLDGQTIVAPTLLRVETAAAIRRLTGDPELASAASTALDSVGCVELLDLTEEAALRAADVAATTGVRGADAVYLELATRRGVPLVTWDRQQLERGSRVARVETP